jgi:hypothetical protein
MKTAWECRAHAAECRALAKSMDRDSRRTILELAEIWDDLALDRQSAYDHPAADALKAYYDHIAREPVPPEFLHLLDQLRTEEPRRPLAALSSKQYW